MNYMITIEVCLTLELLQLGHKNIVVVGNLILLPLYLAIRHDVMILTLVRSLISSKSVLTIFAGERRIVCNERPILGNSLF